MGSDGEPIGHCHFLSMDDKTEQCCAKPSTSSTRPQVEASISRHYDDLTGFEARLLALPDLVQSAMMSNYPPAATATAHSPWSAIGARDDPAETNGSRHCRHRHYHTPKQVDLTVATVARVDAGGGGHLHLRPPAPPPRPPPGSQSGPEPLPRRFVPGSATTKFPSKDADSPSSGPAPGKPHTRHKRWTQVGEELRGIAEDFRSNLSVRSSRHLPMELKASHLFSLLIPATMGPVWTTVILLIFPVIILSSKNNR
ncbi:unnamed protein product [Bemisia tabaci]|uniref:Uncharacterized protein n=1 Tax=Bemisia tabaci TaxID=7038 RepID=A0A9P0AEM2_BEMTA|nr:unnamed protein product [Bemisia tabaci]